MELTVTLVYEPRTPPLKGPSVLTVFQVKADKAVPYVEFIHEVDERLLERDVMHFIKVKIIFFLSSFDKFIKDDTMGKNVQKGAGRTGVDPCCL